MLDRILLILNSQFSILNSKLMAGNDPQFDEQVITREKQELKKPRLFKVLLHNDNYTTMDFVVYVLITIFNHNENMARDITLQVHNRGLGVAGVFTYEIAETKAMQVTILAQENEYPLLCTLEEE